MRLDFKSEKRGYTLILDVDLLGTSIRYRRWYGLHNRRGGMKEQVFFDRQEAMREIERIKRVRNAWIPAGKLKHAAKNLFVAYQFITFHNVT